MPVEFELIGGQLCLDFANTIHNYGAAEPEDDLTDYAALVAWGQQTGITDAAVARRLLREAARRPAEAQQTLAQARVLRNLIYRLFSAIAQQQVPAKTDLKDFNAALTETLSHSCIAQSEKGFIWAWQAGETALGSLLWPVIRSVAEVLTSADLHRVRECAGANCTWLFWDQSKNRTRRWCDMKVCGNRAKFRRHYERKRAL